MEKTREEKIKEYKKSNAARKEKLALKAGFATGAEYLASLEKKIKIKKTAKKASKKKDMLDYVVAFDTTGSMASYIENVKAHIEKLIPDMFSQDIDLKMKIIAFGDYCDMSGLNNFGKAYQESQFTDNQSELISFTKNAKNTSGGDSDEFYELIIKKITEETPWREGAKKAVLFIADCNPHEPTYNHPYKTSNIDWKEEARKAAKINVAFDTLAIHGNAYPWYKELSSITGGVYMQFRSSSKMSEVFTASAYARGSSKSKMSFNSSYTSAMASGDAELIGTYKSLSSLLDEK